MPNRRLPGIRRFIALLALMITCTVNTATAQDDISSGTVFWGELSAKVRSFNPLEDGTYEERVLKRLIYGPKLFEYDPYSGRIVNGIVENILYSADSLRWIINISDTHVFHDGNPVTAEDVVFSLSLYTEYVQKEQLPYNTQLDRIERISVIGPFHFQIDLSSEVSDIPHLLNEIPVLPRAYYEGGDYDETRENLDAKPPVGFGAFSILRYNPESGVVLERFNKREQPPSLVNTINIRFYSRINQMMNDFFTGALDVIPVYNLDYARSVRDISRADTNYTLVRLPVPFLKATFIDYNLEDSIVRSRQVREATALTFEKPMYTRSNIQFDIRSTASGPLPENSWAYFDEYRQRIRQPSRAIDMLAEEGWNDANGDGIRERNGTPLSLELLFPENDSYFEALVRRIKLNLGETGIEIVERPVSLTELRNRVFNRDFQLALDFSRHFSYDLVKTFYDFYLFTGADIRRNRPGNETSQAILQLQRAARMVHQEDAREIFRRLQFIHDNSLTSVYLTMQHHRYVAINGNAVGEFKTGERLLPVSEWQSKRQ